MKSMEDEVASLTQKFSSCEEAKAELQERLDFYIQRCSVFEKNDSRLQDEVTVLQGSIKMSTIDNSEKLDKYQDTIQTLENAMNFYKGQVDTLLNENETLRKEAFGAKSCSGVGKLKCDAVEELLRKQEKIAAQLRRKDWEIENYQKKLDSAFESGMSLGSLQGGNSVPQPGMDQKSDGSGSPEAIQVLDLSIRKDDDDDTNNNKIKVESCCGEKSFSDFLRNRKYSELSDDVPNIVTEASDSPLRSDSRVSDASLSLKRPNPTEANPTESFGPDAKRPNNESSEKL